MKELLLKIYFYYFAILAKIYLFRHKPFIIWVTWSIWKTSCRMIISQILKKNLTSKVVYTSDKNFNGELWMSFSVLWISDYTPNFLWVVNIMLESLYISLFKPKKYDVIVLEYWIDHIWEMDFLLFVAKPDFSIITKIDKVHSKQFVNTSVTASEKYKLLINSKNYSYLNACDSYFEKYQKKIFTNKIVYSTDIWNNDKLDIFWENQEMILQDNLAFLKFDLNHHWKKVFSVKTNMIWDENIWYIAIWYDILDKIYEMSYNNSFIEENLWKTFLLDLELQPSRFSIFKWINNSVLVDSTYNAAPWSMKVVISNTLKLHEKLYSDYELIFVLWEMRELWDYTESEHHELADFSVNYCKNFYLVWDSMDKYFTQSLKKYEWINYKHFKNSKLLWESLQEMVSKSDKKYLILFKWSQNTIFLEEAVKLLQYNPNDNLKVCRQLDYWLENKNKFFWQI